ncbi:MAG: hypothetical protein AABW54_00760 [Candidatus Micrarchaeota archaeon]
MRSSKDVSLKDAAKAIALSQSQTEKLALILEENGFLEVHYTLAGIRLVGKSPAREEDTREVLRKKSEAFEESERLEREVMASESMMKFFEKDIMRRASIAEQLIAELKSRREGFTRKELEFVKSEVKLACGQLDAFAEELIALESKESELRERLESFRLELEKLEVSAPAVEHNVLQRALEELRGIAFEIASFVRSKLRALSRLKKGRRRRRRMQASLPPRKTTEAMPVAVPASTKPPRKSGARK